MRVNMLVARNTYRAAILVLPACFTKRVNVFVVMKVLLSNLSEKNFSKREIDMPRL